MGLTANGIGSGLDINGLVSQLMTVESQPLTKLDTKEASYQAQLTAFGQLKSLMTPMQTAINTLKKASSFSTMKASIGDSSLASLVTTGTPAKGSHSFEVTQIAQSQRISTSATTAPSVGAGTLTFTFGHYSTDSNNVTSFTSSSTASVTLSATDDTLEEMSAAINKANIGVRAQVVNNGTTDQLVIASNAEGSNSAFQLAGTGGVAGFTYDASTNASSSNLTSVEAAQDAKFTLDGISYTRSRNAVTDAIDGLTINLLKGAPGTKTTITVSNDRSGVSTAVQNLVNAYNDLNTSARSLSAYNANTGQAGILNGDATVRNMLSQLRSDFSASLSSLGNITDVSQLGITFDRSGVASLNTSALDLALNNTASGAAEFIAGKDSTPGWADRLSARLDNYLNSGGILEARTTGINGSIKLIGTQRTALSDRLTVIKARYQKEFSALDSLIGKMQQTSTYLTQQLASLSNSSSSSK